MTTFPVDDVVPADGPLPTRAHRSLVPITDQFARAVAGDVDRAFWQRIYSPADAYGGSVVTGWIARLYPYVRGAEILDEPNPLLALPIDEPRDLTTGNAMGYDGPGVRTSEVPATLSRVIFNVTAADNGAVALHGGLVAVAQDADLALRPIAGWHVTEATTSIDDVLDRIARDHEVTPPVDEPLFFATAELVALRRRFGSATLFDGAWRIRPPEPHDGELLLLVDLPDGESIGAYVDDETETLHWVAGRLDPLGHPAEIRAYGTSLTLLLAAALDGGGDIALVQTGTLADLLGPRHPWMSAR